jgi:hypothetical protein
VIASDHTAVEIPRNLVRHADGQRLGREPAAFLAYCEERISWPKETEMTHEEFTQIVSMGTERGEDQDQGKGAVEQDQKNQGGNTSMNGQLGHRDEDVELKNADSDLSG